MKRINILITGTGGLGQEILKAAKRLPLRHKIICVDSSLHSPGLYRGDVAYIVPLANQRNYIPSLLKICRSEKVDIILIGTQQELEPLSLHKQKFSNQGTQVIVADYSALHVAADKYLLMKKLKGYEIVAPDTVLLSDLQGVKSLMAKHGFPLFTKARDKSGSREAKVINSLNDIKNLPSTNILQQFLGEDNEFTAGCYLSKSSQFFFILLKRKLFRGTGLSGEVTLVTSQRAQNYCHQIISTLGLSGPVNVQLKIISGRPMLFEINPRFSSTTPIQAGLGMNFVHLAISEALGLPKPKMTTKSQLVLRYFNEIYLPTVQVNRLKRYLRLSPPQSSLENNY